jgi:serine/threonine-protein kinase
MSNLPPPPPPSSGPTPPPPPPAAGYQQPGYGVSPQERAGFGSRLGAALIDGLIVSAFNIPALIALFAGPTEIDTCPDDSTSLCEVPTDGTVALALGLAGVAVIAGAIYYIVLEGRGQTVGKRAVGLRIVDRMSREPIGPARATGRYFGRWLSAIPCYLGYLWMLWDQDRDTWHDKLTTSCVIRVT